MREMKKTNSMWVGNIPKEWNLIKTKKIINFINGYAFDSNSFSDNGIYPVIRIGDLSNGRINYENACKVNDNENLNNYKIIKNDLLIAMSGATVGKLAIENEANIEAYINQRVGILRCKSKINNKFLYYSLNTDEFIKYILFQSMGSAQPNVSSENIGNYYISCPTIEEQEKIVNFLDNKIKEIDNVIEKTKETIDDYKKYRQTIITEAVTKGLNKNVKFKETFNKVIGMIPESWNVQKLKTFISMPVIDGPHESPILLDDGIPYISATAIENGKINFDLMRGYISEEYCEQCEVRYKPKINDILVIKLGATTGQVAIVDTDKRFNIWVPLAAIRCNEIVNSKYIYYSFQSQSLIKQMELMWTFGTQQTLGVKNIEQLYFSLPDKEEQNTIVQYLEKKCLDVDNLISNKEKIVEKLEQYKKSLIYEYVTGKKEVI